MAGSNAPRYEVAEGWEQLPTGYGHRDVAGVAVDSEDRVYLIRRGDHPIIIYDRNGKFLGSWGEGDFTYRTHGIAVGPDEMVYCTDDGNHTVRKFPPEIVPRSPTSEGRSPMIARLRIAVLTLALVGALIGTLTAASSVAAQDALRTPLPTPVKAKLGMLNVPALSPLWLLPEYAAKYNIQMEPVMFQRFADARTALASGETTTPVTTWRITAHLHRPETLAHVQPRAATLRVRWRASRC